MIEVENYRAAVNAVKELEAMFNKNLQVAPTAAWGKSQEFLDAAVKVYAGNVIALAKEKASVFEKETRRALMVALEAKKDPFVKMETGI